MFLSHTCVVTLLIISVVLYSELTVCTFGIYYSTASGLKRGHFVSLITQGLQVAQGRWKLLKGDVPSATISLCSSQSFKQLQNPLKCRKKIISSHQERL